MFITEYDVAELEHVHDEYFWQEQVVRVVFEDVVPKSLRLLNPIHNRASFLIRQEHQFEQDDEVMHYLK